MLGRFNKNKTKKTPLPSAADVAPAPLPRPAASVAPASGNMPPTLPARTALGNNTERRESHDQVIGHKNNEIKQLSYYHPEIKELPQIKEIMSKYTGRSGHFLLRDSFSKPGTYTVTVMHTSGIKHINIDTTATTFYLKDTHFPTLRELIDHYHDVSVPNQESVGNVLLRYPIHRDLVAHSSGGAGTAVSSGSDDGNLLAYLTQPPEATSNPIGVPVQSAKETNEGSPYYSDTIRGTVPMAKALQNHLQKSEQSPVESNHCECGLRLDDSQLPRGWSVHLSREPATSGRIFFLSADGETRWELPMWVAVELTPEQQDRLRDLLRKSDNHLTTMLNAQRARPTGSAPTPTPAPTPSSTPVQTSGGPKRINESSNYVTHDTAQDGDRCSNASELLTIHAGENLAEGKNSRPFGNSDYAALKDPPKDRIFMLSSRTQAVSFQSPHPGPLLPVRRRETLPIPMSNREVHPHYMPMSRLAQ